MSANVRTQVPDLGKRLVAHRTYERFLAEVHRTLVPSQAPAELEPHRALGAGKRLLRAVHALVSPQMCQHEKRGTALVTAKPPYPSVNQQMCREQTRVTELSSTVGTDVWCGVGMGASVVLQSTGLGKALVTSRHFTDVRTFACVYAHVHN